MNIFTDWKFWLFILAVINSLISILVFFFNKWSHEKIVGNDLKHLTADVSEIKAEQKCMKDKLIHVSEDVAKLKGKIEQI